MTNLLTIHKPWHQARHTLLVAHFDKLQGRLRFAFSFCSGSGGSRRQLHQLALVDGSRGQGLVSVGHVPANVTQNNMSTYVDGSAVHDSVTHHRGFASAPRFSLTAMLSKARDTAALVTLGYLVTNSVTSSLAPLVSALTTARASIGNSTSGNGAELLLAPESDN